MKIIRIDKTTIKKNPKAGNVETQIGGMWESTFNIVGNIPDFIKQPPFYITQWEEENGVMIKASGKISGGYKEEWIVEAPNLKINFYRDILTVLHLPEPLYLYDYRETYLKCKSCKNNIEVAEIEKDWIDDEYPVNICPICKSENTFCQYKYESISNVIKKINSI